jgi:hypothetical protein
MDPAGTAWNYITDSNFPRDITVLRANSSIKFADGTKAEMPEGIYNHHQMFTDAQKTTPTFCTCEGSTPCGNIPISLFMGGSEDKGDVYYSTPDGMFDSGYYIGPNDRITFGGDVVNYNMEEKTVYSVTEMDFLRGKQKGFLETSASQMPVYMCNNFMDMAMPTAKKFTVTGKPAIVNNDGYIVAVRGHVHGKSLAIFCHNNNSYSANTPPRWRHKYPPPP